MEILPSHPVFMYFVCIMVFNEAKRKAKLVYTKDLPVEQSRQYVLNVLECMIWFGNYSRGLLEMNIDKKNEKYSLPYKIVSTKERSITFKKYSSELTTSKDKQKHAIECLDGIIE
jgi:hypothetical protein